MVNKIIDKLVYDNKGIANIPQALIMAHFQGIISAVALKTFAYLVNRGNPGNAHPNRSGYRIPVQDCLVFLGPGATVEILNKALEELGEVFVRITYEEHTGERRESMTHLMWADNTRAQAGTLNFEFDPMTVAPLLKPPLAHYGRIQLDVLRKLHLMPAVRLYQVLCAQRHATHHTSWHRQLRDPRDPGEGLLHFFGQPADIRVENFRSRVLTPAVDEVNKTRAFGDVTFEMERGPGRGGKINWVHFKAGLGNGFVRQPRDNRHVDLFA